MIRNKQKSFYFLIGTAVGLVSAIYALTVKELLHDVLPPRREGEKPPEDRKGQPWDQ